MSEPPDLLDPQPVVLVERAIDDMWETINELRQNEPPLWICREIDALVPEATHAIVSMRPDNPALKRIMLLAVSFITKRIQGAQHAAALAEREVKEAEALAAQEAQHAETLAERDAKETEARAAMETRTR